MQWMKHDIKFSKFIKQVFLLYVVVIGSWASDRVKQFVNQNE